MSEFVPSSHVYLDNPATSVDEVLRFLSKTAVSYGVATDADKVFEAFKTREAEGTTGMMGGFAIPHAKCSDITQATVIVVKFSGEVEWDTMDSKPVRCAIALLIPDNGEQTKQLRLLSKVAVLLMDAGFREKVLAVTEPQQISDLINSGLDN
ncbi:MAG: PTS sugar transporter subunit IIA [Tractidigestivibacter sp.]|jgi:PTS system fructose-specific IIA component|uniref:PTS sugar transporter subunit IIA n=1 Tax=Tractidigestivibacter sp. TaxID=2847320 RepID=UPI003D8B5E4C